MSKKNIGSSFDDFLKEDGIYEETYDIAMKRVLAWQISTGNVEQHIGKTKRAARTKTSRTQIRTGRVRLTITFTACPREISAVSFRGCLRRLPGGPPMPYAISTTCLILAAPWRSSMRRTQLWFYGTVSNRRVSGQKLGWLS